MIGRFDPNSGKFGLIICRALEDEGLFLKRCHDSYKSQQGIIIPLTDVDILYLLGEVGKGKERPDEELLMKKFKKVALQ